MNLRRILAGLVVGVMAAGAMTLPALAETTYNVTIKSSSGTVINEGSTVENGDTLTAYVSGIKEKTILSGMAYINLQCDQVTGEGDNTITNSKIYSMFLYIDKTVSSSEETAIGSIVVTFPAADEGYILSGDIKVTALSVAVKDTGCGCGCWGDCGENCKCAERGYPCGTDTNCNCWRSAMTTTAATPTPSTTTPAPADDTPADAALVDEESGVSVSAAEGVLEEGTEIKVETADVKAGDKKATYEITLEKDGAKVNPNGTVAVTIEVPAALAGASKYYVYYQADDGTLTDMNATYADGKVTFNTNHFSTYILSVEPLINESSDEETTTAAITTTAAENTTQPAATTAPDESGDGAGEDAGAGAGDEDKNLSTGVFLLAIPAIAAASAVIIAKKRK